MVKKKAEDLPSLEKTIAPAKNNDIIELDEMWSFVFKKANKRWIWTAICRRTRQIIAFVIGDRSKKTCYKLWNKIPKDYKQCNSFSDFWNAYEEVFSPDLHRCVGKESGETSHMERWYNTLRQRISRFVRKTLSFSKSDVYHYIVTKLFIFNYNESLSVDT